MSFSHVCGLDQEARSCVPRTHTPGPVTPSITAESWVPLTETSVQIQ